MGNLRIVLVATLAVAVCGVIPPAHAQEDSDESAAILYRNGPMLKLGRGVANILTGVAELPLQMERTARTKGQMAGATVGMLRGAGYAIGRTLAGGFEVLTFPFPNPTGGYTPIVQPEHLSLDELI